MGLCSTNRFSNLSAEYVEESLAAENTVVENTEEMLDESNPIQKFGEKLANGKIAQGVIKARQEQEKKKLEREEEKKKKEEEKAKEKAKKEAEKAKNLSECMNFINENDYSLFNALIELDFMEAMDKNMLREASEESKEATNSAKKDGIKKNIDKIADKVEDTIKAVGNKIKGKAEDLNKKDKKLYAKYSKALKNYDNLEGFGGIKNFAFPNEDMSKQIDSIIDMSDLKKIMDQFAAEVSHASSKTAVDKAIDDFNMRKSALIDDYQEAIKKAMKTKENWIPTKKDVTLMLHFMNGTAMQRSISDATESVLKDLEEYKRSAKAAAEKVSENNELQVYIMNSLYRCASASYKIACQKFNAYKDLEIREIAAIRKAIVVCGRYASKKAFGKEEEVNEAALIESVVGDSSDQYVFDLFDGI